MVEIDLTSVGLVVVVIGFLLIFTGIFSQNKGKAKVEGGGIIFIGPIPIVGATSERAFYTLLFIAVVFMVLFIMLNYSR